MKQYFKLLQQEIYHAYETSKLIGHSLPTGNEREIITSRFLERHMPPFIEIGQGVVIDRSTTDLSSLSQESSPQIDLFLAMEHHPCLTFYGGIKFYFAEAIATVIEVKSNITTYNSQDSQLDKILKHCNKVKQRDRQIRGLHISRGSDSLKKIPYYVVSLKADKKADQLIKALGSRASNKPNDQRLIYEPDGFFVLDPENSVVVLKRNMDIHSYGPGNYQDSCFAGGTFPEGGVLIWLWLTLYQQIEFIRLTSFPHLSYVEKLIDMQKPDSE